MYLPSLTPSVCYLALFVPPLLNPQSWKHGTQPLVIAGLWFLREGERVRVVGALVKPDSSIPEQVLSVITLGCVWAGCSFVHVHVQKGAGEAEWEHAGLPSLTEKYLRINPLITKSSGCSGSCSTKRESFKSSSDSLPREVALTLQTDRIHKWVTRYFNLQHS